MSGAESFPSEPWRSDSEDSTYEQTREKLAYIRIEANAQLLDPSLFDKKVSPEDVISLEKQARHKALDVNNLSDIDN